MDEVRPFPVSTIAAQVESRLNSLPAHTAVVAVNSFGQEGASLAVMVNTGAGWSFAGWLVHRSHVPIKDAELGFEVRKSW